MVFRDQPYSQKILDISLLHLFLPQTHRKCVGRVSPREPSLLPGRSVGRKMLPNVSFRSLRQYPADPIVNEIVSLDNIRGLEVDSNDIDELVEEHNQELTTEGLMELHCVSQQEVLKESLSEEEEITAKQHSSNAIREMLKAWETVAWCIEKHHPKKTVAMHSTNLFYDNGHRAEAGKMPRRGLDALVFPGKYLVDKIAGLKKQQQEQSRRKVTERELAHLHHKIVSETLLSVSAC
ncbi:hypothetical protein AVEN_199288-1 [Araneus ventricosus]|uniref:Uncharacterized protein n=1 Tax=Araneus ventricosus TaxID=182803 RepID=A0A4Y2MYP2_ARAVE|nr:hypothetical protein AVEN_199288-1 [Araneus ventricosus]